MGLTLSLYIVYLHNVRHFSIGFATLLLSASALAGLATSFFWGSFTDRFGPVLTVLVSGVASWIALAYWAYATTELRATLAGVSLALVTGSGWGAGSTLLSRLVAAEQRQRAYGVNFMLVNLGIGMGGLVSAAVVNLAHPASFTLLYLGNIAVGVVAAGFTVSLWRHGGPVPHDANPATADHGWAEVLRDRRLVQFAVASIVLGIGGYGSVEAGFSLFVVNDLHLGVHVIGIAFFFNTMTIVLAQLFTLNHIDGRSRTRVMAAAAVLWFVFWLMLDGALVVPAFLAVTSLCLAQVIFAIGETVLSPLGPALVNEMAPEHLRGRYNSVQGLSYGLSGTLAPLLAALYFDHDLGNWWPVGTGVTALLGGAMMLNLRRHLTPGQDGRAPLMVDAAS